MLVRSQWFSCCMGLTKRVQPYCMLESMTVQATIRASCAQRLTRVSAGGELIGFGPRLLYQIRHRGGHTARRVRDAEKGQAHLHAGQGAREHEVVEAAEVPDAEDAASN